MSPTLRPPEEVRLKRTAMSTRELRRAEVLARGKSQTLRMVDAAEMLELDGSFHAWFEERGPRGCLMNMVDDATATTCCRLGEQETIWSAVGVLRSWIEKYGVPRALYTDWKNVYKREPTEKERLRGKAPTTQLGGMCERLEIRIIAASSPQAKRRV